VRKGKAVKDAILIRIQEVKQEVSVGAVAIADTDNQA